MTVKEIVEKMKLEVLTPQVELNREIEGGYCGDLLSFVMAHAKEKQVWITIQGHINSVAVASLLGIGMIVLAEGQRADATTIEKAVEEQIPITTTSLSSFEFAMKYSQLIQEN